MYKHYKLKHIFMHKQEAFVKPEAAQEVEDEKQEGNGHNKYCHFCQVTYRVVYVCRKYICIYAGVSKKETGTTCTQVTYRVVYVCMMHICVGR